MKKRKLKKMKNLKLILGSLLLTLGLMANASEPTLLYKISGKGVKGDSYLYGTIHMMCPDEISLDESIKAAIKSSKQLILELDMDDPEMMLKMQTLSVNPNMQNVGELISEEDKTLINEKLKSTFNSDLSQFGILKPFVLNSMIMTSYLDCPQAGSYEQTIMSEASEDNKAVIGLETLEDQISIFDAIPAKEQMQWLVKMLNDEEKVKEDLNNMLTYYKTKDLDGLYKMMGEYPEYKALEDELLIERNNKWIPTIEKNIKKTPSFIAVGAAHLATENGVIALLRAKGYTVSPVQ